MPISQEDIEKTADLAKIEISDEQASMLCDDLSEILKMVAKINDADTDNVQPLAHPLDATQPLRVDQVTETNQRELFQSIAPKVQSGLYIVPKVIDAE